MLYTVPCTLRNLKKDREDVGFRFDDEGNWRADQRPSSGRRPGVRERAGHARRVDASLSFDRGASGKDLR